jgi:putative phosphonate metabolism protein
MPRFERYAIYYTPPPGPLATFGAAWLGWDIATGTPVAHPEVADLPAPVSAITQTPRRYGLHATLMPPFHLAENCTETDLHAGFERICAQTAPAPIGPLKLAQLGRFLALVPTCQDPALTHLAARIVQQCESFRAPLAPAELHRRDPPGLTAEQRANLLRWGYAHVMEQFRFHITLTGKHPKAETTATLAALRPILAPWVSHPFNVDALSLVGQDASGRFHTIARSTLRGPQTPPPVG